MKEKICLFFQLFIESLVLLSAALLSVFVKSKKLWLISERGTDARDNGFTFFRYLKQYHPEIDVKYVISKDSVDRLRFADFQDSIVDYKSFLHFVLFIKAKCLISTHIQGYSPCPELTNRLNSKLSLFNSKIQVSLKHGITKDYIPTLEYKNTRLDLLCCGAKPEFDYMNRTFGYPNGVLKLTGFCRFDNLSAVSNRRQILVMPTWRRWLHDEDFITSDYFLTYTALLNNKQLLGILKERNLFIVFYPHHEVQPYIDSFKKQCHEERVIIADKSEYDVQTLLNESNLLITDYSSVLFDFAYMDKPSIYFQFDEDRYRTIHYAKGYFCYENSFGPVVRTISELISSIKDCIDHDFKLPDSYKKNVDYYFPIRDKNNCNRVYESIMNISRKKQ